MTTIEKVAYIKGLMEGMKIDETSDNGKLFKLINQALAAAFKDDEPAQSQQAEGDPQTAAGTGEPS